jgi:hypothetical protein
MKEALKVKETSNQLSKARSPQPGGHRGGAYSVAARQQAVEAWKKSGMTLKDFAKVWGVGRRALHCWKTRYVTGSNRWL